MIDKHFFVTYLENGRFIDRLVFGRSKKQIKEEYQDSGLNVLQVRELDKINLYEVV